MRAVVRPLSLPADRRVLVISDIHGNLPFLKGLLKKVQFSTDDILLVLGDILEKSTGGLDTLRYLMDLRRTHTLFFLQGNCENVTLDFLNGAWPDQARRPVWKLLGGEVRLGFHGPPGGGGCLRSQGISRRPAGH